MDRAGVSEVVALARGVAGRGVQLQGAGCSSRARGAAPSLWLKTPLFEKQREKSRARARTPQGKRQDVDGNVSEWLESAQGAGPPASPAAQQQQQQQQQQGAMQQKPRAASAAGVLGLLDGEAQAPAPPPDTKGLHSETFVEDAPLGMNFTEAFHNETQEMYIHLGKIKPGTQGATRGLVEGMRLIQVDGWRVHGVTYDDVIAHIKRRPVTLHFVECEAGRALHGSTDDAADAAGPEASGAVAGWQTLCAEAEQLRQSMAAAVAQSNALLGIAAPALAGSTEHHGAAVDATLEKLKARRTVQPEHQGPF